QSLQLRHTWGYEYSGLDDPSRMTLEEISVDGVITRLKRFFKNANEIPRVVPEYCTTNPPRAVSTHACSKRSLLFFDSFVFMQKVILVFYSPPPPPGSDDIESALRVFR
ncbi:hypothetical protein, partial [Klebsiella pneumoniae]|uniref:hypothetical protein n=1 Tax=Klebsiella pneumoniae TaxID=573 RepID=UPI0039C345BB